MKDLGVEVAINKTFISKNFLEFAKRFYLNGIDVSPFPMGAFVDAFLDKGLIGNALDNALSKG